MGGNAQSIKRWVHWLTSRHNVLIVFCVYNVCLVPVALRELGFGVAFGLLAAMNVVFATLFLKRLLTSTVNAIFCIANIALAAFITAPGTVSPEFMTVIMLGNVSGTFFLTLYDTFVVVSAPLAPTQQEEEDLK